MGSWLWSGALNIYAVSAPTTVVASYNVAGSVIASRSTLGVINTTTDTLSVIDLAGPAPSKVDYALPIGTPQASGEATAYAAASAPQWVVGSDLGVLLAGASLSGGTPRFFGYGQVLSLAANANRIALATASGTVLYFNASTLAQEGAIQFTSGELALSPDGSILAAAPAQVNGPSLGAQVLNIYSLPAGSTLYSWPYPASSRVSLAGTGAGTVLAQTLSGNGACKLEISAPTGGTPSFCSSTDEKLDLSPDGTVFSTLSPSSVTGGLFAGYGTNLYQNNKLVTAVSGWPAGWIDNGHVVVNIYKSDYWVPQQLDYQGCAIYGPTGMSDGTCLLPEVLALQTVDSSSVYANNANEIINVGTGVVTWASGNPMPGGLSNSYGIVYLNFPSGLAGNHVVFASGAFVVAQSHP
jgi:hypothetical protein